MEKLKSFRITALHMEGFKSYSQPTDLTFGDPTVITGGNVNAYRRYKKQVPISKETLTQICWEVGMSDAADFIKFESDEQERYREITEEF